MPEMTRPHLSARERRVVLVGSALIAALVVAVRGIPAWQAWHDETLAAAAELVDDAERAERSIQLLEETIDSTERRRERLVSYSAALMGGGSPSSAVGALAARISGAAAAARLQLGSVQLQVDTAAAGSFTRVSVRASGTGDIRAVAGMLADLERGPPLLAVREWSVTATEPAAPAHQPEVLHVELLVEGIALSRGKETAP
jgi:hypothetical protein